jgi:hypothetical protein
MKPEVYRAVRDRCQAKLRELFVIVATPIEGPAKQSFGDIDLFVAWKRKEIFPPSSTMTTEKISPLGGSSSSSSIEEVARALSAVRRINESMAIPWPEDLPSPDTTEPISKSSSSSKIEGENEDEDGAQQVSAAAAPPPTTPQFIQVDAHVCGSLDHLQWMLFKHAHGDLWNILGSAVLRPFGLTVDEVGLYVRIPEIEALNKKEAKVLLSTDPNEILRFLGLRSDDGQWEEPFACDEDVFEYAATCRLFYVNETEETGARAGAVVDGEINPKADEGNNDGSGAAYKRHLKANDRRRMAYRPLFRKWVDEFLPACRASGRFTSSSMSPPTRTTVREEAFEYFPSVQATYERRIKEWNAKRQLEILWKAIIKPAVPLGTMDNHQRGVCASALKKIIIHGDDSFDGIVAPASLKDEDGLFNELAVQTWVENNWRAVSNVAWEAQKKSYVEKMERKRGTKRAVSGSDKPDDAVSGKERRILTETVHHD